MPTTYDEQWPTLRERLEELVDLDRPLNEDTQFTLSYTWTVGYEKCRTENPAINNSVEFAGAFHPVQGLCIGNPCRYCGNTSYD